MDMEAEARLVLPNREVAGALRRMVRRWLGEGDGARTISRASSTRSSAATPFTTWWRGTSARMLKKCEPLVFPTPAAPEPGAVLSRLILVVGLLAGLDPRYEVRSNRESGFPGDAT